MADQRDGLQEALHDIVTRAALRNLALRANRLSAD